MTSNSKTLTLGLALIGAAGALIVWNNLQEAPKVKPASPAHAPTSPPIFTPASTPLPTPLPLTAPSASQADLPVVNSLGTPPPASGQDGVSPREARATAQIEAAAATYAPSGIDTIAPFLLDASPVVRQEAIYGLIRLSETGGAKALREAASKMKDPREAVEMLDAAEYLELPPAKNLGKLKSKKLKAPQPDPNASTSGNKSQ